MKSSWKRDISETADNAYGFFETAYITGWRVHSEILTRQKVHLDLKAGWLRLEPGDTKNRKGRMFPLTPRLHDILEQQLVRTEGVTESERKDYSLVVSSRGAEDKALSTVMDHGVR